jgi:hypothetical protein
MSYSVRNGRHRDIVILRKQMKAECTCCYEHAQNNIAAVISCAHENSGMNLQVSIRSFSPQAEVFEEIATMEFPFEGIPTVPPRKDMTHLVRNCK